MIRTRPAQASARDCRERKGFASDRERDLGALRDQRDPRGRLRLDFDLSDQSSDEFARTIVFVVRHVGERERG